MSFQLKALAGNAPHNVLCCPIHDNTPAQKHNPHPRHSWLLQLECTELIGSQICREKWFVCKLCPVQQAHMRERAQLSRHIKKHESKNIQAPNTTSQAPKELDTIPDTMITSYFSRDASSVFFEKAKNAAKNEMAVFFLVAQAVLQDTDAASRLEEDDVHTFMSVAYFVSTLSRPQRESFALVTDNICNTHERQQRVSSKMSKIPNHDAPPPSKHPKNPAVMIPIPRTKQDLRRTIVVGKNCLFANLPHPKVYEAGSHAYLLPSECVADLMAHGIIDRSSASDKLHSVDSLACSPVAQAITQANISSNIKTIIVSRWSDDFEPNGAKDNRGSIWISTLTIQTVTSGAPGLSHVYPIAVGHKNDDHEEIERLILNDLKKLNWTLNDLSLPVTMYNGLTKQNEKVSVHLVACTQDQPERRGANGMLGGGSIYHARFGYSVDISQFIDTLPACIDCLNDMEGVKGNDTWVPRDCNVCHNWLIKDDLQLEFEPSSKFPTSEVPVGGKLPSLKLSYKQLLAAKSRAHQMYYSGEWTQEQFHEYLKYYCLSFETREKIRTCAHKCNVLNKAEREQNEVLLAKIELDKANHPDHYKEWEPIMSWKGLLELDQSHEACMHLLFLGLAKYMILDLNDWAALRGKYKSLCRSLYVSTSAITGFHLSWCKVFPFQGEKLGGWVSENFMGFARILPWAYSSVLFLAEDPPYQPPNKNLTSWTGNECKEWLRSRGLGLSGKVQDLRDRITLNIGMPIGSNHIVNEDKVRRMVLSLWTLLCHLMGMTTFHNSTSKVTERLIRVYLTRVDDYDRGFRDAEKRKEPMWKSAYNHMCLLNLPEQIRRLGPIRNHWEGGFRGEGFIRKVKPMTTGVGRKNWTTNLLTNLLRQRTLILLKDNYEQEPDDELEENEEETAEYDWSAFHKYVDRACLSKNLNDNNPLSCLIQKEENDNFTRLYCCYNNAGEKKVAYLEFVGQPIYKFGSFYFCLHLEDQATHDMKLTDLRLDAYGLLLPIHQPILQDLVNNGHLGEAAVDKKWYTLVDSKWRAIGEKMDLVFPHTYIHRENST